MRIKGKPRPNQKDHPERYDIRFALFSSEDAELAAFIQRDSKLNRRTAGQQVIFMLHEYYKQLKETALRNGGPGIA